MSAKTLQPAILLMATFLSVAALAGQEASSSSRRDSLAPLNRRTFGGNVLTGGHVDHWVVLFCVDWFPVCEEIQESYMDLARHFETALNNGALLRDVVRFASVDCAVDKVLCNEQLIDDYPTVVHYSKGKQGEAWTRSTGKLPNWLEKELLISRATGNPHSGGSSSILPWLSEEDRRLVARVLASVATLIIVFIWAVGHGTDLWLAAMSAQPQSHTKKESKQELMQQGPPEAADVAEGRAARRLPLPQEWACERGSLEL
eukprot:CAMPEP_0179060102 /NCGR_PEP_ID=MMETSP0796-20121207/25692_1 /TAXON_ID=73915 /ORGANISM="Pyrodinium bahamense, Strain pbaha01" /LENGTH=258 /DNA_ID=CAMNT_0020756873 /DNA_START=116 /DNA_END=892 /DNA_ORIENTATION=+